MSNNLPLTEEAKRNHLTLLMGAFGSLLMSWGVLAPLATVLGKDITLDIAFEGRTYIVLVLSAASLYFSLIQRPAWLLYTGLAAAVTLGSIAIGGEKSGPEIPGMSHVTNFVAKTISIQWGSVALALGIITVLGVGIWRTIKR